MRLRLLGAVFLIGGACLSIEAYRELANTPTIAEVLAEGTKSTPEPIDPVHWAQAWRSTSLSLLLMAMGVTLTGFALLLGRYKWAWGVFSATLVVDTLWLINQRLALPPHYVFEATWVYIIGIGFLAAVCCGVAWREISQSNSRKLKT